MTRNRRSIPTVTEGIKAPPASLTGRLTYLRNCWYLAAWSDEVPEGGLLARRLLDEPVVLFRTSGTVSALLDRCLHRFAPLSKGQVTEGSLVCGYHGLGFDGRGNCVRNPHGPIPKDRAVRHFPIVEAYRGIWIWMGDPAETNPDDLRNLSFLDDAPNTAFSKGYIHGRGDYQLFVDNILDLSHADFLHPSTLGGGALTRTRATVTESNDRVSILYDCNNETPSPLMKLTRKLDEDQRVDFWTHVEWSAPAVLTLSSGGVPAGAPRDSAGVTTNVHILTPESARTTHYFFAATRAFAEDDAALNEWIAATREQIFANEDGPMIESQQERMGDAGFWELRPMLLNIDEGSVRVRRKLERMIARESGAYTA